MEGVAYETKEIVNNEDELICFSPLLPGFALENKEWFKFHIDNIKPVVLNDEAYKHLVYPEEQKDLVFTFVNNHQRLRDGFDDVIQGNGRKSLIWMLVTRRLTVNRINQGLAILISGPPGTGKTLIAEASN